MFLVSLLSQRVEVCGLRLLPGVGISQEVLARRWLACKVVLLDSKC